MAAALGSLVLGAHACDRVPLLAPSGSAITLTAAATALTTDSVPIVALVLEGIGSSSTPNTNGSSGNSQTTSTSGGGTPVHNGTHVSFTTTSGTITPADATTVNGKVTVTLDGAAAGDVIVTATSGAAVKTATIKLSAPASSGGN